MTDLDPRWRDAIGRHAETTPPTPAAWAAITDRAEHGAVDPAAPRPSRPSWLLAAAAVLVVAVGLAAVLAVRGGEDEGVRTEPPPGSTVAPTPGPGAPVRVEGFAGVLEDDEHGPEACFWGMAESLPPQCSGLPLPGWDWAAVAGEESAGEARWGSYHVVGDYDGETLTVVGTPEHDPTGETAPPFSDPDRTPPCDPPAGGWDSVDGEPNGAADRAAMEAAARTEPDVAGVWLDARHGPGERDVYTAAFTGAVARHRAELRELWGGPLCVVEREHTLAELQAAQVRTDGGPLMVGGLELEIIESEVDEIGNQIVITMTYAPEGTEEALEEDLGVPVRVEAPLRPAR
ncbi:MAG TPA: hypothetical protein VGO60_02195 [Iamia sp.]|jgi:hypothetical protein|nr:hypothetical protein [Iamia sp.]